MREYSDFPDELQHYFSEVDRRFADRSGECDRPVRAAKVDCYDAEFADVRAVMWDLYGTLLAVGVGDLADSSGQDERLEKAAAETVREFNLEAGLRNLYPMRQPAAALRDRYLALITLSHEESHARGIEYPEVRIEEIWQTILRECHTQEREGGGPVSRKGLRPASHESTIAGPRHMPRCELSGQAASEPLEWTAYRCGYFFDCCLQRTSLSHNGADCLRKLTDAGVTQGIISNAQFYTPLHVHRLFCKAWGQGAPGLNDIFAPELILFSYEQGFSKPNARSFEQAVTTLRTRGIEPAQTVYIGNDMLNDVWGARQVGWRTILYVGDEQQTRFRYDDTRCCDIRPDAISADLGRIANLLCGS